MGIEGFKQILCPKLDPFVTWVLSKGSYQISEPDLKFAKGNKIKLNPRGVGKKEIYSMICSNLFLPWVEKSVWLVNLYCKRDFQVQMRNQFF